jgi:hypothetical protein
LPIIFYNMIYCFCFYFFDALVSPGLGGSCRSFFFKILISELSCRAVEFKKIMSGTSPGSTRSTVRFSSGLFSPQVIDKRVAVRAPPPDRDGALPAVRIKDPDIGPEHMPAPGLCIPRDGPAFIGAGGACAHTIRSLWHRNEKPLGRPGTAASSFFTKCRSKTSFPVY